MAVLICRAVGYRPDALDHELAVRYAYADRRRGPIAGWPAHRWHVPNGPELERDQPLAADWRCIRCGAFKPAPPTWIDKPTHWSRGTGGARTAPHLALT